MNGSNEFDKARRDDLEMKLIFRVVSERERETDTHTHTSTAHAANKTLRNCPAVLQDRPQMGNLCWPTCIFPPLRVVLILIEGEEGGEEQATLTSVSAVCS